MKNAGSRVSEKTTPLGISVNNHLESVGSHINTGWGSIMDSAPYFEEDGWSKAEYIGTARI
jgi:hypothetical protein